MSRQNHTQPITSQKTSSRKKNIKRAKEKLWEWSSLKKRRHEEGPQIWRLPLGGTNKRTCRKVGGWSRRAKVSQRLIWTLRWINFKLECYGMECWEGKTANKMLQINTVYRGAGLNLNRNQWLDLLYMVLKIRFKYFKGLNMIEKVICTWLNTFKFAIDSIY